MKRVSEAPKIKMEGCIMKATIERILSTFPQLRSLSATEDLRYTLDEINENGWIEMAANRVYQLKRKESSYETEVRAICDSKHCPKMTAVNYLINKVWKKGEQAVFCLIRSINVLNWVSDVRKTVEWYHEKNELIEINIYDWFVKSKWRWFISNWKNRIFNKLFGYFIRKQNTSFDRTRFFSTLCRSSSSSG